MPRQKSLVTAIRDMVRREVADMMQGLLMLAAPTKKGTRRRKAKNGRRKRRGPGRPPKSES